MIPRECKRLAEVDFPIAVVSKYAAKEKSIRHGHPSTLHLWWARRPLASSRAVLLALLLPDPCDPHCPPEFKGQATEILTAVRQRPESDAELRKALTQGFSWVYDVVRRFAQPLGIDLEKWEKRTIEIKKGVVRLLPVAERATVLFGKSGSRAVAAWLEQQAEAGTDPLQGLLFPDRPEGSASAVRERRRPYGDTDSADDRSAGRSPTTLDRVHTGMLLQAGGRTNALRALVQAGQERGPDFLRLANALSALYPRGSEEKRLLDAMLLAAPR